jgi:hypothetical protein
VTQKTKVAIIAGLLLVLSVLFSGCNSKSNGDGSSGQSMQIGVSISPSMGSVQTSAMLQFSDTVVNTTNTAVTWQVNGTAGGSSTVGTITSGGLYTAPAVVPNPAGVTVTVVSQADTSATASASITITAPSAFSITPSSVSVLAGATQQFKVTTTGATPVPAVTWQVNGTVGGSGTTGTITAGGLYTAPAIPPSGQVVTVTAVSQSNASQSASSTVTVDPSLATLNGQYAYAFSGSNAQGTLQEAGTFTADGKGNLTNGIEDVNSGAGVFPNVAFTGTYTVGPDGRGSLVINPTPSSGLSQETFDIVLVSNQSLRLIRFDLTTGSGTAELQGTSAFTNSALSGNYIVNLDGIDGAGGPLCSIGLLDFGGNGDISSGELDQNDNGTVNTQVSASGNYTVASNGRGTMTLKGNLGTFDFAFYVVSTQKIKLVSTNAAPVWIGSAILQQGSGFSNSTLTGRVVFGMNGNNASGAVDDAGTFPTGGASGSITSGIADENSNGVLTQGYSFTGSYTINNNGYGSLQIVSTALGTFSYSLYLESNTQGVLLSTTSGTVAIGHLYTQNQSSFAASDLNGAYAFSVAGVASNGDIDKVGQFTANGSGSAAGTEDVNEIGTLTPKLAMTITYTLASDGRGSLNITASGSTRVLNFYLISPSQMLLIGMDTDQVLSGGADQQFQTPVPLD